MRYPYRSVDPELLKLVEEYIREMGRNGEHPTRVRSHWITMDLVDKYGSQYLDSLRTTPTLKASVELCLRKLGYVDEGICGSKVWIKKTELIHPYARR